MLCLSASTFADVAVQQLDFTNGDDREPAIDVDGQFICAAWPHIGPGTIYFSRL